MIPIAWSLPGARREIIVDRIQRKGLSQTLLEKEIRPNSLELTHGKHFAQAQSLI